MSVLLISVILCVQCLTASSQNFHWKKYKNFEYNFQLLPKYNFSEAQNECRRHYSNLVSIHSADENAYLLKKGGTRVFWIGAQKRSPGSNFTWIDGSPFDFSNFAVGEPNNAGGVEDCLRLNVRTAAPGYWNDFQCKVKAGFICKRRRSTTKAPGSTTSKKTTKSKLTTTKIITISTSTSSPSTAIPDRNFSLMFSGTSRFLTAYDATYQLFYLTGVQSILECRLACLALPECLGFTIWNNGALNFDRVCTGLSYLGLPNSRSVKAIANSESYVRLF